MNNIFDLLDIEDDAEKPGLTSEELQQQLGLSQTKIRKLLQEGVIQGKVESVAWLDKQRWSGRPRVVYCWKKKEPSD